MQKNKLHKKILDTQAKLENILAAAKIEQKNKLFLFEKHYNALLKRFPEIIVWSDVNGGAPKLKISDLNKGEITLKLIAKYSEKENE